MRNWSERNAKNKRLIAEEERNVDDQLQVFKRFQSPAENLQLYLSTATLPYMTPAPTAPPFSPDAKYKVHRNHLQVRVSKHRSRFKMIMASKYSTRFSSAVMTFCKSFPKMPLEIPDEEADTGYAFTVPAFDFKMRETPLPYPSNLLEIMVWINTFPIQTMTRAMHAGFPDQSGSWDVTTVNDRDPDKALWQMLVWRKTPKNSELDKFYKTPSNASDSCSMLIVVQPPWILSPGDIHAFVKCRTLPPFNTWDPAEEVPMSGAERMWAKLWDNCIKRKCHHWVITTYFGWIFGMFSVGFTASQVYCVLSHDSREPTVLEALLYHTAASMGIVKLDLPQALESFSHATDWEKIEIPEPEPDPDMEFPDSGSEWEGCDDEPGISAGVSHYSLANLSAFGSEHNFHAPAVHLPRDPNPPPSQIAGSRGIPTSVASLRVMRGIQRWNGRIENGHREMSPVPERPRSASPGGASESGIYASMRRDLRSQSPDYRPIAHVHVEDEMSPLMEFVMIAGTRLNGQGHVERG